MFFSRKYKILLSVLNSANFEMSHSINSYMDILIQKYELLPRSCKEEVSADI